MIQCERQGYERTPGMADDNGTSDAERFECSSQQISLLLRKPHCAEGPAAVPKTGRSNATTRHCRPVARSSSPLNAKSSAVTTLPWRRRTVSTFRHHDVIPNERLVYSDEMHLDDKKISVSLATTQLKAEGRKTTLMPSSELVRPIRLESRQISVKTRGCERAREMGSCSKRIQRYSLRTALQRLLPVMLRCVIRESGKKYLGDAAIMATWSLKCSARHHLGKDPQSSADRGSRAITIASGSVGSIRPCPELSQVAGFVSEA
jgi:hypothetical protein